MDAKCRCHVAYLTADDIRCFVVTEALALWAVYQRCAVHEAEAMSPVWSPRTGFLMDEAALITTECGSIED